MSDIRIKLARLLLAHFLYYDQYPIIFILGKKEEGDLLEAFKDSDLKILNNQKYDYLVENIPVKIVNIEEIMICVSKD